MESPTARIAAGIIALIAWLGLAVQLAATFEQSGSLAASLWIVLRYFTILTNLLVALVMTALGLGKARLVSPALLGGVTLAIVLVGVVYSLLLRGLLELSGGARLADFLLHDVVPVLVPIFWLLFAPKRALRRYDPLLWALYPFLYVIYALARGAAENKYAYPFIDVAQIGWLQTATNSLLMALAFLAAGFALVWLDRRLGRQSAPRSAP